MLIQALNKFEGTFILVSHDRYFIQQTANKIWEIEDGKINVFEGTYLEWEDFKTRKKHQIEEVQKLEKKKDEIVPEVKLENAKGTVSQQKEKNKEEKKMRNRFNKLESELGILNHEKSRLENLLASSETYSDKIKFQETEKLYNQSVSKITMMTQEYEELFEQLMNFESE